MRAVLILPLEQSITSMRAVLVLPLASQVDLRCLVLSSRGRRSTTLIIESDSEDSSLSLHSIYEGASAYELLWSVCV
jgi:hypothetical protein